MKNVLVINAHEEYDFSKGELNRTMTHAAVEHLQRSGYETQVTTMKDDWEIDAEIDKHVWADAVILQSPVNWMGVPWSFKKYMDLVYTYGMDGRLYNGDGRTRQDGRKQYGSGGSLTGTKYMISLTFNAPRESFGDPEQVFFEGKTVDDVFWPMHLTFRFMAMEALPTFTMYDVMKNPDVENNLSDYRKHLAAFFPTRG